MSAAGRVAEHLLAQRLARTAGRWPRELFGEAEVPTLRRAISERVSSPALRIDTPEAGLAASARDAGQSGAGQNWVDLYTGMRGDTNRAWRGHEWTVRDRSVAREYGPNVRQSQGDISGAVTIRLQEDLRQALGARADELMTPFRGEIFDYLDNPAIREELRARGVGAVHFPDDSMPTAGAGNRWHESYLILDEGRLRNAPDGGASGGGNLTPEQLRAEGFNTRQTLYHGTGRTFDRFEAGTADSIGGGRPGRGTGGVWLTDRPAVAADYANRAAQKQRFDEVNAAFWRDKNAAIEQYNAGTISHDQLLQRFEELHLQHFGPGGARNFETTEGANVVPVHVRLRNPLVVRGEKLRPADWEEADFGGADPVLAGLPRINGRQFQRMSELVAYAREAGHDGIVFRRMNDAPSLRGRAGISDNYLVFDPSNVVSRFGRAPDAPNAGPRGNGSTLAGLAALPPGALTLRELLRDRYGTA